jgi:hypothetical protein
MKFRRRNDTRSTLDVTVKVEADNKFDATLRSDSADLSVIQQDSVEAEQSFDLVVTVPPGGTYEYIGPAFDSVDEKVIGWSISEPRQPDISITLFRG